MNIASIALDLASFRSQTLGSLLAPASSANSNALWASASRQAAAGTPSSEFSSVLANAGDVQSLSATGRNLALYNPESAYKMMSVIKSNDASYKAQFSELSEMKSSVAQMQDAGQRLSAIDASTSDQGIASRLQDFVAQYNGWVERFNPDMQNSGVLADTQAAQVSRHELDQSIENPFNGARDGVHGLADLGLTIDPNTGLASLDSARLNALLASNRQGGVDAVQEFSSSFSKSAKLLNSDGNFIPNRLNNLSKVIDYFAEHKISLQNEFGTGDSAKPTGRVAQALAAYNQRFGA